MADLDPGFARISGRFRRVEPCRQARAFLLGLLGQPSYWQVELEMIFQNEASLEGLDELNESDTGFSFDPIGPARGAEIATVHAHYLGLYPQLRALWNATPVVSKLSMHQAD